MTTAVRPLLCACGRIAIVIDNGRTYCADCWIKTLAKP